MYAMSIHINYKVCNGYFYVAPKIDENSSLNLNLKAYSTKL